MTLTRGSATLGGAITNDSGTLTIRESSLSGHAASSNGGAIFTRATLHVFDSTFYGNTSDASGGAIDSYLGDVSITGSTLSGNSADRGGAVAHHEGGTLNIRHSTLTGNEATDRGGGVWTLLADGAISHTILSGNNASIGDEMSQQSGSVTLNDYNVIGHRGQFLSEVLDGISAGPTDVKPYANADAAPLASILDLNLANNGGPTLTHALVAGSPAVNRGDPADAAGQGGVPAFDQRGAGFSRVDDGRIDIGSIEATNLTLVVNTSVDEMDGSITDGDVSLRDALAVANVSPAGDTITFAPSLAGSVLRLDNAFGALEVTDPLTIDGGNLGVTITGDANGNDVLAPGTNITDLAASTDAATLGDNVPILRITTEDAHLTLAGLTLTGGRSTDSGGAVGFTEYADFTLIDSTVSGNSTTGASAYGGAIAIAGEGKVTIQGSTISGNATYGRVGAGGAMHVTISKTVITSSTFSGNRTHGAYADAGALSLPITAFGEHVITNSTFHGNSTAARFAEGGAIHSRGDIRFVNTTVSGNSTAGSSAEGGGLYINFGDATLVNSVVTGNSTATSNSPGGGIYGQFSSVSLINSMVTGNVAVNAGDNQIGAPQTTRQGGTIQGQTLRNGASTVQTGLTAADIFAATTEVIDGNGAGTGVFTGVLADNGGATATVALLATGAAVDTGDSTIGTPPAFDQRGAPFVRIAGAEIDIGAFEVQTAVSADFDEDGDIDGSDFLAWQRGFGTPNAMKADGDADNDLDVDSDDLTIWTDQYGQPAPLASSLWATSAQPLAVERQSVEISEQFIDAAMAFALRSEPSEENSVVVEDLAVPTDTARDLVFASSTPLSPGSAAEEASIALGDDDAEARAREWLADELLERVFQ